MRTVPFCCWFTRFHKKRSMCIESTKWTPIKGRYLFRRSLPRTRSVLARISSAIELFLSNWTANIYRMYRRCPSLQNLSTEHPRMDPDGMLAFFYKARYFILCKKQLWPPAKKQTFLRGHFLFLIYRLWKDSADGSICPYLCFFPVSKRIVKKRARSNNTA